MEVNKILHKISLLHSVNAETPTSIELARMIINRLNIDWTDPSLTFLDPTCGRGTFLLALLEKLERHGHSREHIITNMLYGIDKNEIQSMITKKALQMAKNVKSNIECNDSLKKKFKTQVRWVVGNYPFNDDSLSTGRDTDKVKENTKSLDHEFYKAMIPAGINHAVILRSNCLGKDSSVRQLIFTDPNVKEIVDTTNYFNVSPDTMCVIRDNNYNNSRKTIVDRNNQTFDIDTDSETKLSLSIGANNITLVQKIWKLSDQKNLGELWTRSPINRNAAGTKSPTGVDFVEITGDNNKPLEITKFDGDTAKVKFADKWKVISNVNASRTSIGAVKIVAPGTITSNSIIYFAFNTQKEAKNCKKYLETQFIKWYTPLMKVSAGNSSEFFAKVPSFDFTNVINDDTLKSLFTKSEQNLIWI